MKEKNIIELKNKYYKKENKIYKGYDQVIREIQKFKMMFNNVYISNMSYIDERLKGSLKIQNDR